MLTLLLNLLRVTLAFFQLIQILEKREKRYYVPNENYA